MRFGWECNVCNRRGYFEGNRADTCQACHGQGKTFVEGFREDFTTCNACQSSGFLHNNRRDICGACNGIGIVPILGLP